MPQSSVSTASRDLVYAQTDHRFNAHVMSLFGYRYEAERGLSRFDSPSFSSNNAVDRSNMSFVLATHGDFCNRFFYSLVLEELKRMRFSEWKVLVAPSRSTLAYANEHRPWEPYQTIFYQLLENCQTVAASASGKGKKRKFRFKNRLLSLDATVIALCASVFDHPFQRQHEWWRWSNEYLDSGALSAHQRSGQTR